MVAFFFFQTIFPSEIKDLNLSVLLSEMIIKTSQDIL